MNKSPLMTRSAAFTLIELLLVIGIVVVLAAFLYPSFVNAKQKAQRIRCTSHMKQTSYAFRLWAGDYEDRMPMDVSVTNGGAMEAVMAGNMAAVFLVMSNELNTPKILFCPTDKKRIQATTFPLGNTNVSYFVGLEIGTNSPGMLLAGDDNLLVNNTAVRSGILSLASNAPVAWSETRHRKQGNVAMADHSVQGFSTRALQTALANTGVETNRLAMP